jgi:hypothetical protein
VYPSSGIEVDVTDHEAVEAMVARVIDSASSLGHLERRVCAALPPFEYPVVNGSDRPFSIAQLRIWNGSSCPERDLRGGDGQPLRRVDKG